jgi:beta-galactosidase
MDMRSLCNDWEYTPQWSEEFLHGGGSAEPVRLPHSVSFVPRHYAKSEDYEKISGYRLRLKLPQALAGKRLFVQFDGAAHIAQVYLNGTLLAAHGCGYTAFRVELTGEAKPGQENLLCVRLDSTENAAVPPFGFVIDYLTYGGLYREAWLDVRNESFLTDVFVTTPSLTRAEVTVAVSGSAGAVRVRILDAEGTCRAEQCGRGPAFSLTVPDACCWDTQTPNLYTCQAALLDADGAVQDEQQVTFGFRTAEFKADGFYLNGKRTFLRGLNRHQSYPYVGYAAPERLQREDARILKNELQCNAVRTSHYPQSRFFVDECDRLGLLVFTELPGWQHIGGAEWKRQACEDVREMVLQYRNHPSIILWGVRINESVDDDAFYRETNAIAHALDPSRATSGVRYLEKSSLLEDVYAFNDFSHSGSNGGVRPKGAVTPDRHKALLISECNGHMFPTKAADPWQRRQEQALRHARVQNDAMASGEHAGCFGWCMFDYSTHKDFGSGDRVCYHGVMDEFRNPKLAAALYASQGEEQPVLEVGSSMDIGDYPAGHIGMVYVFTNAPQVRLYKNDVFVSELTQKDYPALPHSPLAVRDTIGNLLQTQEGFPKRKAELLRRCLLAAGQYGLSGMPLGYKLQLLWAMLRYHMRMEDGVALFGKYIGNWGGEATRWRFDAVRGETVLASVTRAPGGSLQLQLRVSSTVLTEGGRYDMAAVRVRVLDEFGNPAPYAMLPVTYVLCGDASLVGEEASVLEGGMGGVYVRTAGRAGTARLTVSTPQTEPVCVEFTIRNEKEN